MKQQSYWAKSPLFKIMIWLSSHMTHISLTTYIVPVQQFTVDGHDQL